MKEGPHFGNKGHFEGKYVYIALSHIGEVRVFSLLKYPISQRLSCLQDASTEIATHVWGLSTGQCSLTAPYHNIMGEF